MVLFVIPFVLFFGLFSGVYLSYHTCEEQKTAMKYLEILKIFFSFLAFLLSSFLLFDISIDFFIVMGIIILLFYLLRNILFFNQFLYFCSFVFASIFHNFYLIGIVFLLSIFVGTIETNKLLFSNYDSKKFTTETKFKLKEIKKLYLNVLLKYQYGLYLGVCLILFLFFY